MSCVSAPAPFLSWALEAAAAAAAVVVDAAGLLSGPRHSTAAAAVAAVADLDEVPTSWPGSSGPESCTCSWRREDRGRDDSGLGSCHRTCCYPSLRVDGQEQSP